MQWHSIFDGEPISFNQSLQCPFRLVRFDDKNFLASESFCSIIVLNFSAIFGLGSSPFIVVFKLHPGDDTDGARLHNFWPNETRPLDLPCEVFGLKRCDATIGASLLPNSLEPALVK